MQSLNNIVNEASLNVPDYHLDHFQGRVLEELGKSRIEGNFDAVRERVDDALGRLSSITNELKRLSAQKKKP